MQTIRPIVLRLALLCVVLTALFVVGGLSSARAGILADIDDDFPGGGADQPPTVNTDYGWQFTLTQDKLVTALGFWDEDSNGLTDDHEIGLWTTGGTLLATVTIDNSSTVVASAHSEGRWLFEDLLSPLTLNAGTYILGADYPSTSDTVRLFVPPENILMDPNATWDGLSYSSAPVAGLQFPNQFQGNSIGGYFGPNLMMQAVPEPSSFMLVAGLVGGGWWKRRRSAAAKTTAS